MLRIAHDDGTLGAKIDRRTTAKIATRHSAKNRSEQSWEPRVAELGTATHTHLTNLMIRCCEQRRRWPARDPFPGAKTPQQEADHRMHDPVCSMKHTPQRTGGRSWAWQVQSKNICGTMFVQGSVMSESIFECHPGFQARLVSPPSSSVSRRVYSASASQ